MANAQNVNCKVRTVQTKGYLNKMKRDNYIPGVVYGKGQEAVPLFFEGRELNRIFERHGSKGLFSLQIEGEKSPKMALIRELQKHPVSGKVIHVDFLSVNMNEKIHSTVSIIITGEQEIINNGGIPQLGAKEVEVLCLPRDLPESFTIDGSALGIGHKIAAADLKMPEGVELASDPETILITVLAPGRAATAEAEPTEGEEGPAEATQE